MEKGFNSIIGRAEVKKQLEAAVFTDRLANSYIISGEPGSGKKYIAKLFAMAVHCEHSEIRPCMECRSCRMALSGNHPDIIYITHEKPGSIGVDEVRKQLVEDVDIRPYCSKRKIYIVPDASKMTVQAQNALLKTLEQPPEYCVILLLSDNDDALLPTIRSRCVRINTGLLSDEEIREYLITEMLVPDYEARLEAAFAQGNIGTARNIANAGDFQEKLQSSIIFLRNSRDMDAISRIDFDKKIAADKQGIYAYLQIFRVWFRDVLYFKASNDPEGLVFRNEIKSIRQRAQKSSYEGLMTIIDSLETAENRLRANVNPELVLELLFLRIGEN